VVALELDDTISQTLADFNPDVVFPVLHGPPGEDGTLQGFLEILGYTYVGSDVHASSAAMNKILAKQIFALEGLPLAKQVVVERVEDLADAVAKITDQLGCSVVVKPATQGSALGDDVVQQSAWKFTHINYKQGSFKKTNKSPYL